jgi:hypothetical protein
LTAPGVLSLDLSANHGERSRASIGKRVRRSKFTSIVADRDAEARGSADLGWMLFDHGEASGHSRFFEAYLRDGSISVPSPDADLFAS